MGAHKNEKLTSLLEQKLAELILREIDVAGALVTVEDVAVSDDLVQARVRLSIIPHEKEVEVYNEVEVKKKELAHKILKSTKLRRVPTLRFEINSQV